MNWKYSLGIFTIAFLLIATNSQVHADIENIKTDKILYKSGETIIISGNAGESNSYENISVIVRDSNKKFVVLDAAVADSDGLFELPIEVNSKFLVKGLHSAQMYIDDIASDEITYFDFSPTGSQVVHSNDERLLLAMSSKSVIKEQISAEEVKLVNSFGAGVHFASEDKPIQISSKIVNLVDGNQSFVYLVQIRDGSGTTISVSWLSGMMTDDQIYDVALSWTPEEGGSYFADVYVWQSIADAVSLSEPETIPIIVA